MKRTNINLEDKKIEKLDQLASEEGISSRRDATRCRAGRNALMLVDADAPRVTALTTEYMQQPLGIDVEMPRLGWRLEATGRGCRQSAYRVQVADSCGALEEGDANVWDSEVVSSASSQHVPFGGPRLESRKDYFWRVCVWDEAGRQSDWSHPASWEMGLLHPTDWLAHWIEAALAEPEEGSPPCPMLRTTFQVDGEVERARVYVTARGLYQLELNGLTVGDRLFTPGWTSYGKRLLYQTYDVSQQLRQGQNGLGAMLGDGWYRGFLGWEGKRDSYGERLALLLQLHIDYADGRIQTVISEPGWRASTGAIVTSDIYNGETYDARLHQAAWSEAGFDDGEWARLRTAAPSEANLVAQYSPPVRRTEEVTPVSIARLAVGSYLVDLGQNIVGWVRLRASGPSGTEIVLRHAEVLTAEGDIYADNLRSARQTDRFILAGDGVETFEPHFTFHGFRYVRIDNYPGTLETADVKGVVIHSDLEYCGKFECSDERINRLQCNIVWGQRGNFLDVPTDCPQRDERLGWTGDAQVFIRTACYNMNAASFFVKWLEDLRLDQHSNGSVPHVIPDVRVGAGAPGWGDAAVICPWTLYQLYGDERVLERQFDSMRGWVDYMETQAGPELIWRIEKSFGDWLSPPSADARFPQAVTDNDLIATAFFAHSAQLVSRAAAVLDREEDENRYRELARHIKEAFRREFQTPSGRLASNTQTAYALALEFDLLTSEERTEAARRLAEDVRKRGHHLSTGFLGTPLLCHALSKNGYAGEAFALLTQEDYPSWLYPLSKGATTIWERWDGIKQDLSFQDPTMNSFNHYAYGAVGDWLYRGLAGIDTSTESPGYRHSLIRPLFVEGLSSVSGSLETLYGTLESHWERANGEVTVTATIPPNTSCSLRLPLAEAGSVKEGGVGLESAPGVRILGAEPEGLLVELGSGSYSFSYRPGGIGIVDAEDQAGR